MDDSIGDGAATARSVVIRTQSPYPVLTQSLPSPHPILTLSSPNPPAASHPHLILISSPPNLARYELGELRRVGGLQRSGPPLLGESDGVVSPRPLRNLSSRVSSFLSLTDCVCLQNAALLRRSGV